MLSFRHTWQQIYIFSGEMVHSLNRPKADFSYFSMHCLQKPTGFCISPSKSEKQFTHQSFLNLPMSEFSNGPIAKSSFIFDMPFALHPSPEPLNKYPREPIAAPRIWKLSSLKHFFRQNLVQFWKVESEIIFEDYIDTLGPAEAVCNYPIKRRRDLEIILPPPPLVHRHNPPYPRSHNCLA